MKVQDIEINAQTGEQKITERELTDAEIKIKKDREAQELKAQAEIQAKENQRQEIAERIGLTLEELKLLLG